LVADTTITDEMKRHTLLVSVKAKHRNFEIARFLKVATSFVCKVRKGLLNENNGDEPTTRKRKGTVNALLTHSEHLNLCEKCTAWHDGRKSWEARLVYVGKNNSRESFIACKTTLNQIEAPRRTGVSFVFLRPKKLPQGFKKSIEEMISGYVRPTPLKFQLPRTRTKFPATVTAFGVVSSEAGALNADADAYVETLQTIVVKAALDRQRSQCKTPFPLPPPPPFQDWMAENFHHHVAPYLWPPPNYSPDLNPFHYYVWGGVGWGVIEKEVNRHPKTPNSSSLMEAIARAVEGMDQDHLI
ncbi:hypothetical protein ACTXT7_017569, partial [Hymenolepis weldensis]